MAQTWKMPELPPEPPMSVVRVRAADGMAWWHIRPGEWYPAPDNSARADLARVPALSCDRWSHVLKNGPLVDDTKPGEPPIAPAGCPTPPPRHLDSDSKLLALGCAAGYEAATQMVDVYARSIGSAEIANAQLWSLREAIREELRAETAEKLRALAALMDHIGDGEENVIRNIREFADGQGEDPRVEARRLWLWF